MPLVQNIDVIINQNLLFISVFFCVIPGRLSVPRGIVGLTRLVHMPIIPLQCGTEWVCWSHFHRNHVQWPMCNADFTKQSQREILLKQNDSIESVDIPQMYHFLLSIISFSPKAGVTYNISLKRKKKKKSAIYYEQATHVKHFESIVYKSRKNKNIETFSSLLLYKHGPSITLNHSTLFKNICVFSHSPHEAKTSFFFFCPE